MNPPEFFRSKVGEDLQLYNDVVRKTTQIMHVTEEGSIELASYRLNDVAYNWVIMWKEGRGENTTLMSWQVFEDTFLDRFFA